MSLMEGKLNRGIGGHHSARAETDDWLTPPNILTALGAFDLDPCASMTQPWPTAKQMLTKSDNGLMSDWSGRVWLNPPYGREAAAWLDKLSMHGDGIALVFARTETEMFFRSVWSKASAVLFLRGRINFHFPDGRRAEKNAGGPSVLIAYGVWNAYCLESCGIVGHFVRLRPLIEVSN